MQRSLRRPSSAVILNFGLGVTYYQLVEFVNKRNIRAPWALDEPITRPIVVHLLTIRHLRIRILDLRQFYRRPWPSQYEMLLALYSYRKYQYNDESEVGH